MDPKVGTWKIIPSDTPTYLVKKNICSQTKHVEVVTILRLLCRLKILGFFSPNPSLRTIFIS